MQDGPDTLQIMGIKGPFANINHISLIMFDVFIETWGLKIKNAPQSASLDLTLVLTLGLLLSSTYVWG